MGYGFEFIFQQVSYSIIDSNRSAQPGMINMRLHPIQMQPHMLKFSTFLNHNIWPKGFPATPP